MCLETRNRNCVPRRKRHKTEQGKRWVGAEITSEGRTSLRLRPLPTGTRWGGAAGLEAPPRPRPRPGRSAHPLPAPPRPPPRRARWPGSMAAAAGAPPPGPPQPPPPPPPEESSDSEPEAEPGSPQKLIRKVSTSGQIRQKVSPRRRPGARPSRRGPCRGP